MFVTSLSFGAEEYSIIPVNLPVNTTKVALDLESRRCGNDWTYLGDTMKDFLRIKSLKELHQDVFKNNITGDLIETGVWHKYMPTFARVIQGNNQKHRKNYV
jgi:hypothetical protein